MLRRHNHSPAMAALIDVLVLLGTQVGVASICCA